MNLQRWLTKAQWRDRLGDLKKKRVLKNWIPEFKKKKDRSRMKIM